MPTRFASLAPVVARLLLAGVAALVALGFAVSSTPSPRAAAPATTDIQLYRAVAARADTPSHYYAAVTAEQRAHGYPLHPFVTVREPALALLTYRLGGTATAGGYILLAIATVAALAWRFRTLACRPERIAATGLTAAAVLLLTHPALASWHEAWAGLLLALAIAARDGGRWGASVVLGLAALLVRELALPAVLALGATALADRRPREALGWAAAILLFGAALAGHAAAVAAHLQPGDLASPGWTQLGGWRFVLEAAHSTSLLIALPRPLVAVALPLALLGWAAPGRGLTDRVAIALAATLVAFMVVGRPDNIYWGLMVAPLLPAGLAFAPRALRDLARQAAGKAPSVPAWANNASS